MRFLDLAVAALIGSSSLLGIVSMAPGPYVSATDTIRAEVALRDRLLSFVVSEGLPSILEEPFGSLCLQLLAWSNSTLTLSAAAGASSCGNAPSDGHPVTLPLEPGGPLVLEAWYAAGA